MRQVRIVYVDDDLDIELSKFLGSYKYDSIDVRYEEVQFNPSEDYLQLLCNESITTANVIIIDSKLFEDSKAKKKFSGEEMKLLIKKAFPFIEVIVITSNEINVGVNTSKYSQRKHTGTPSEFYNSQLSPIVVHAINNVLVSRDLADKIKKNKGIDKLLAERIVDSLDGEDRFDGISKSDIDSVIEAFKSLQSDLKEA